MKILLILIALLLITNIAQGETMKILKIEAFDRDKIVVTVEGYPHAQPVFPADTKAEDLKGLLEAWKTNQDSVDLINAQAKLAPKTEPTISEELKALENKEI